MAERSYPFDSGPGATVTEDQWSKMADPWQDDGVFALGNWIPALQLTSAQEALILHIAAGEANIAGFHYELDAPKNVSFATNATANPRLDRYVLKLDRSTNTIAFLYKQGTAAASPIAPSVYKGNDAPEILIATFQVRANSSTVLPADIIDDREFAGRRIRTGESGFGRGNIHYRPSDDKFYVNRNSVTEALITDSTVPPSGLISCTSTTRPASPAAGTLIWETDTRTMRWWTSAPPGGAWIYHSGGDKFKYKNSQTSRANHTSEAADPDLFMGLDSNADYIVDFWIIGQASPAANWSTGLHGSNITGYFGTFSPHSSSSDADHTTLSVNMFGTNTGGLDMQGFGGMAIYRPRAFIRTSSGAATCEFWWTQRSSNASPNIVAIGSYMHAKRVA